MTGEPTVEVYASQEELQAAAAARVAELAETIGRERGAVLLAISGGSTPPGVFRRLCDAPLRERVPWDRVSVIWCDERVVPFDSPDSNYLLARQTLLDHVPIPSIQVYPVPTYYDPERAAEIYSRQVAALLQAHGGRIDIALLGMGPDGHTASLFPGHPQLDAPPGTLAVSVLDSPKPPPARVTLTAEALNRAAHAIFLVAGADKAAKARAALRGPYDPSATPAQIVRPADGELIWMLDAAAGSDL